jgi:hypothetical protein
MSGRTFGPHNHDILIETQSAHVFTLCVAVAGSERKP